MRADIFCRVGDNYSVSDTLRESDTWTRIGRRTGNPRISAGIARCQAPQVPDTVKGRQTSPASVSDTLRESDTWMTWTHACPYPHIPAQAVAPRRC